VTSPPQRDVFLVAVVLHGDRELRGGFFQATIEGRSQTAQISHLGRPLLLLAHLVEILVRTANVAIQQQHPRGDHAQVQHDLIAIGDVLRRGDLKPALGEIERLVVACASQDASR